MKATIKNLVGSPFDMPTLNGPAIMPAFGTLTAEFDPQYLEALKEIPGVKVTIGGSKAKPSAPVAPVEPQPSAPVAPVEPQPSAPVAPVDSEPMGNVEDLRKIAVALGIEVKEKWDARRLQAKIDAVLNK